MFELKGEKEPISLVVLVVAHFLIGAGIMYIGEKTKNRREFLGGIAFILIAIIAYLAPATVLDLGVVAFGAFFMLSALSWLYLLVRLHLINQKKEVELKLI